MAEPGPGRLRAPGAILLVSTYELGHQPAGIAWPKAFLEAAGFAPSALDLAVEPLDPARVRAARLVLVSVPMHTALRLALRALGRLRELAPEAALAFHGLYALMHAPLLERAGALAVLGGECEEDLVALAEELDGGGCGGGQAPALHANVGTGRLNSGGPAAERPRPRATLRRLRFPVPSRQGLPPPARYARLVDAGGGVPLAGYVEASRGCKHRCRHCPIPAVYGGRFFAVPVEVVVADAAQQVEHGVTHLTFGDPDFLNGPTHALRVAEALHARFPALTFDFTAKVQHLVNAAALLPRLHAAGALFAVSAVESLSEAVLLRLDKGHTRADVHRAYAACRAAGIALRPSLLPFTPWSTLDEYLDLLDTFEREGWVAALDPVQLSIRLLVPPGSLLLADPALARSPLGGEALSHLWRHPDPRMDALQAKVACAVEDGAARSEAPEETFRRVRQLALAAAGRPHAHVAPLPSADTGRRAPRLTESWFC